MPRKNSPAMEENQAPITSSVKEEKMEDEVSRLNSMLGTVMKYISDEEIVEIDIEYLLDSTDGLRKWWDEYREKDRKRVEEEIKKSLSELPLEELQKIREQIKGKQM